MAPNIYRAVVNADTAQKYLDQMVDNNRKAAETTVRRYARDMLDGNWINDGTPIQRRASDNRVMNGNNRLHAVLAAAKVRPGIEVEFTVAENVPDAAFAVIDTGRARNNRDALVMGSGGRSSGKAAPIVTWVWKYLHGNPMGTSGARALTPTRSQFLACYDNDPEGFETSSLRGQDTQRRRIAPHAVAGTMHYLMKTTPEIGEERTEDFFDKYISGANLSEGSMILQLREKFTSRAFPRSLDRAERGTFSYGQQLYLFHRTWRGYATDDHVGLTLPRIPVTNETFPKLYLPTN